MPGGAARHVRAIANQRKNKAKSSNSTTKSSSDLSRPVPGRSASISGLNTVEDVDMSRGFVRKKLPGRETRTNSLELDEDGLLPVGMPKSKNNPGAPGVPQRSASTRDFETADLEVRKSPYYSDLQSRDKDALVRASDEFYYKVIYVSA